MMKTKTTTLISTMTMTTMSDIFPMYSFRWTTPDGTANIFVTETKPITISITIGKAGTSIAGWAYALSQLVNLALRNHSVDEVIDILTDITTHQSAYNSNGVQCRSTPEAVAFALTEYKRIKLKEMRHVST